MHRYVVPYSIKELYGIEVYANSPEEAIDKVDKMSISEKISSSVTKDINHVIANVKDIKSDDVGVNIIDVVLDIKIQFKTIKFKICSITPLGGAYQSTSQILDGVWKIVDNQLYYKYSKKDATWNTWPVGKDSIAIVKAINDLIAEKILLEDHEDR